GNSFFHVDMVMHADMDMRTLLRALEHFLPSRVELYAHCAYSSRALPFRALPSPFALPPTGNSKAPGRPRGNGAGQRFCTMRGTRRGGGSLFVWQAWDGGRARVRRGVHFHAHA